MKNLFLLLAILLILFGIGSGIYFEFTDDQEDTPNWKKGFFRLAVVSSLILGLLGGAFFANLAKKGELVDLDDDEPPPEYVTDPKATFIIQFIFFFALVWLVYVIVQWPPLLYIHFCLKGFQRLISGRLLKLRRY